MFEGSPPSVNAKSRHKSGKRAQENVLGCGLFQARKDGFAIAWLPPLRTVVKPSLPS